MQKGTSTYDSEYSRTVVDPVASGNPAVWPQMAAMLPSYPSTSSVYDLAMRTMVPERRPQQSFRQEARGGDDGNDHLQQLLGQEQLTAARMKNREDQMRLDAASRPAPVKFVGPDYTSSGFAAHYTQDPSKMSAIQREMFLPKGSDIQQFGGGGGGYGPAPRGAMAEAMRQPSPREQAQQYRLDDEIAWSNFDKANYNPTMRNTGIPTKNQRTR